MNKYAKLAQNTLIFAIGSFGSKILLLLLNRLYTTNMDAASMSTKGLLEQTANFLIPVVTFSIAEAVIRYGLDKNYDNTKVFTSACLTELAGTGLLLLASPLLSLLPYVKGYTVYLVVYIITSSFRQLCSQFVRAREMTRLFALDGILSSLSLFCFSLLFIRTLHWGVAGFMLSVILSDFCSGVFLWLTASLGRFFSPAAFSPDIARAMLRFSLPMIPTAVLWIITGFSDRLFVRYMKGFALSPDVGEVAAGVYEASSKVPNLISMFSTIFFQAWNMSAITEHNAKDKSLFYYRIYTAYQACMFLCGAVLIAFVRPLSNLLIDTATRPDYVHAYQYTPVLIIAVLMMSFNQFLSSIYVAAEKTSHSMWTALLAAGSNLILNFVLIYRYGVHGAVMATFLSYFLCYLVRIVDTRRMVYFKVQHGRFLTNLLVLFFMSYIAVKEPSWGLPVQAALLVFMCLFNVQAFLLVGRILSKVAGKVKNRAQR